MSDPQKNIVEFNNYAIEFDEDMEPIGLKGVGKQPSLDTGVMVLRLARELLEVTFKELGSLKEDPEGIRNRLSFTGEDNSFILLPPVGRTSDAKAYVTLVENNNKAGTPVNALQNTEVYNISPEEITAVLLETRRKLKRRAFRFYLSIPYDAEDLLGQL